eukprot:GSMAST32.ASY1.ANO1.491.1 assembled CDS
MGKSKGKKYYAIVKGKSGFCGVVETWDECKKLVNGVKGGVKYKSFKTKSEATAFVVSTSVDGASKYLSGTKKRSEPFMPTTASTTSRSTKRHRPNCNISDTMGCDAPGSISNQIIVYTDGACSNNQDQGIARAGYGAWFGDGDIRNISAPLEGEKQTNQRAEMTAVLRVAEYFINEKRNTTPSKNDTKMLEILIKTDSKYTIKGIQMWTKNWKKNGWRSSKGSLVKNIDLWKSIDKAITELKQKWNVIVTLEHVKGHSGEPGNEAADRLAVAGAALVQNV